MNYQKNINSYCIKDLYDNIYFEQLLSYDEVCKLVVMIQEFLNSIPWKISILKYPWTGSCNWLQCCDVLPSEMEYWIKVFIVEHLHSTSCS